MIICVPALALSHLHPALRLAGPAQPVTGRQRRRAARATARGRRAAPHPAAPQLDSAGRAALAALIRLLPARLRLHRLVWINLSPYESDEFGVPRAYVQLTTTSAEDDLANAMDAAAIALADALAGGNQADVQLTSQDRDGLGTTYHEAAPCGWVPTPAAR